MTAHEVLTLEEVSALLKVPRSTLRSWRSLDRGPRSFKSGRAIVYLRADVDAFIAAQYAATARGGTA